MPASAWPAPWLGGLLLATAVGLVSLSHRVATVPSAAHAVSSRPLAAVQRVGLAPGHRVSFALTSSPKADQEPLNTALTGSRFPTRRGGAPPPGPALWALWAALGGAVSATLLLTARPAVAPRPFPRLLSAHRGGQHQEHFMVLLATADSSRDAPLGRKPPWGYSLLACVALLMNVFAPPLLFFWMRSDPHLPVANAIVGLLAMLISFLTSVAGVGLIQNRYWGVVLSIVSSSLSVALCVVYGLVRLALVAEGRWLWGASSLLATAINVLAIVYWALPMHRRYLRRP
eukprot:EG_transcript_16474